MGPRRRTRERFSVAGTLGNVEVRQMVSVVKFLGVKRKNLRGRHHEEVLLAYCSRWEYSRYLMTCVPTLIMVVAV